MICILLIDSVASFNFNPHTKTEIPGIEKIKIVIKVNSLCLSTVGHLHSFFFRSEGALFLPGFKYCICVKLCLFYVLFCVFAFRLDYL